MCVGSAILAEQLALPPPPTPPPGLEAPSRRERRRPARPAITCGERLVAGDIVDGVLVSRGSVNHFKGQCRACWFNCNEGYCRAGANCNNCHFDHPEGPPPLKKREHKSIQDSENGKQAVSTVSAMQLYKPGIYYGRNSIAVKADDKIKPLPFDTESRDKKSDWMRQANPHVWEKLGKSPFPHPAVNKNQDMFNSVSLSNVLAVALQQGIAPELLGIKTMERISL